MNEPVSVIIPAYNEESGIENVITGLKIILDRHEIPHEITVVDDGSVDRTFLAAKRAGARVIRHMKNRGYGSALKTGILASKYETIVITDADGTYPVNRIPDLIEALKGADMAVGARVSGKKNISLVRRPAKLVLKHLSEYITGENIPDLNSGMRAFSKRFAKLYFGILPDKFSFTTTITVAMLCDGFKISYVPIDYYKRSGKSKIVPWDFVNFMGLVLRLSMLFNPLKVFVPVALFCFIAGGMKFALDIAFALIKDHSLAGLIISGPVVSASTLIMLLSGLQILLVGMMSDGLSRKIANHVPFDEAARPDAALGAVARKQTWSPAGHAGEFGDEMELPAPVNEGTLEIR